MKGVIFYGCFYLYCKKVDNDVALGIRVYDVRFLKASLTITYVCIIFHNIFGLFETACID